MFWYTLAVNLPVRELFFTTLEVLVPSSACHSGCRAFTSMLIFLFSLTTALLHSTFTAARGCEHNFSILRTRSTRSLHICFLDDSFHWSAGASSGPIGEKVCIFCDYWLRAEHLVVFRGGYLGQGYLVWLQYRFFNSRGLARQFPALDLGWKNNS